MRNLEQTKNDLHSIFQTSRHSFHYRILLEHEVTDDMIEEKSLIARIRGEHGYLRGRRGELANNIVISDISVSHEAITEHRDHAGFTAIGHTSYRGRIPLPTAVSEVAADFSHTQAAELQH